MEVKERFLQHIGAERRLSPKTVEAYEVSLRLFDDFLTCLPDSRTLLGADGDNIREWMEQLMEQGCSAAYVNRSLAALRTFYKFCLKNELVQVDPAHAVVGPKIPKRLPRFFKDGEMERLFQLLDERIEQSGGRKRFDAVRTRTIIYVFYLTGLRASELISLDDSMVDMLNFEMKVTGKRNKQRVIPFAKELSDVLNEYIAIRDATVSRLGDALFVDDRGNRMKYEKVKKIVKENMGAVSSLAKCTPHVLRHTFATSMLNNDANLESVKKLLGHQRLGTTEIYTHTTFEKLRRIYNEAHPRK